MKSELNFWFLDDGNLGGEYGTVMKDFAMIITKAAAIGLEVRPDKCQLFFLGDTSEEHKSVQAFLPPRMAGQGLGSAVG